MTTRIALLRGINVGGRNKIPMAELRSLCSTIGFSDVRSYIQSGNLIFSADGSASEQEKRVEGAIEEQFGLHIPVLVRSIRDWERYVAGNPFPDASEREPNLVMLGLSKAPPREGAAEALMERGREDERVVQIQDALWIHFPRGSARSKITPSLLDRHAGSPVTTRNWRTVLKLDGIATALP